MSEARALSMAVTVNFPFSISMLEKSSGELNCSVQVWSLLMVSTAIDASVSTPLVRYASRSRS